MKRTPPSRCALLLAVLLTICAWPALSLAVSPELGLVLPRGGQRGTELDLELSGKRLADSVEILFYDRGLEVLKLEPHEKDKNRLRVRLKIAKDCRLGEHALRVRTLTGLSELRTFWVGALPSLEEKEPNNQFAAPQEVSLDVTIAGVIESEDVDWFRFEGKKGERVTAEIEGLRSGLTLFDPYLAILDAARFELAAADDSPLLRQDAVAWVILPQDGQYTVQVRESAYGGSGSCRYRLHLGRFPRPLAVLPAGGPPGQELELRLLGDAAGEATRKLSVPDGSEGLTVVDEQGESPSPLPFRLVELENTLEAEPNAGHGDATAVPALPAALNGVIAEPGDRDAFVFTGKKNETWDFRALARGLRSPLDPVLRLHRRKGGQVAANDDSGGPDSYFRAKLPDDGEYVLSIEDHLKQGSPIHAYRIEVTRVAPRLAVNLPQVRQYSQERQVVVVPRGNRTACLVAVQRSDFGGEVVLGAESLPEGVTMAQEIIPGNLDRVPVVFEAKAEAPVAGGLHRLTARHADESKGISGGFEQRVELIFGQNNSLFWKVDVDRLAIAVVEEVPYRLKIIEPRAPLARNGVLELRVEAERAEGYEEPIELHMVFNPPGVSTQGGVKIAKGQTAATLRVTANGGAQVRDWKIAVQGSAKVADGTAWVSSPLATLRVVEPFFTVELAAGSVELGQEVEMLAKIAQLHPFEGKAALRLAGLPARVTAPTLEVTKETKELIFKVTVAKDSPPGKHRSVFTQVELPFAEERVVYGSGGAELRIDKPLPPKKPKPQAVAKAPPKKPKPEKKPPKKRALTRLEKLRAEFQKEREGEGS